MDEPKSVEQGLAPRRAVCATGGREADARFQVSRWSDRARPRSPDAAGAICQIAFLRTGNNCSHSTAGDSVEAKSFFCASWCSRTSIAKREERPEKLSNAEALERSVFRNMSNEGLARGGGKLRGGWERRKFPTSASQEDPRGKTGTRPRGEGREGCPGRCFATA